MKREKALLPIEGEFLIQRIARILRPIFAEIVVVTTKIEVANAANLPAISDRFPNRGPLGGIHAALEHFQKPTFVVACDLPNLNADFIRELCEGFVDEAARVPRSTNGFEPLHAVYAPACLPIFQRELQGDEKMKSMRQLLEEVGANWVFVDERLEMFSNWNTPEDVQN